MKKILSFLGAITLIETSTTSLIACDIKYSEAELKKIKEENKISINGNTLEWMELQEKPFKQVDNKWYFVILRGDKNADWRIVKFKNNEIYAKIQLDNTFIMRKSSTGYGTGIFLSKIIHDQEVGYKIWPDIDYFKAVYRWEEGKDEPEKPVIDLKTGKITDWNNIKEVKEDK